MTTHIPGGFILLSRQVVDSEIFKKPPLYLKVWIYLLTNASYADYKSLKRGQLVTSIPEIIDACTWFSGYRQMKPTKDEIRNVLDWLRASHGDPHGDLDGTRAEPPMVTTTKTTRGMLINIENYWLYQDVANYGPPIEDHNGNVTDAVRRPAEAHTKNKKLKNKELKNKEKEIKTLYTELVSLLPKEYETLLELHGEGKTKEIIELLHNYKLANGKKYVSDYGAINSWVLKRWEDDHEKLGKRDERHTPKNRTVQRPKQSGWINKPDELPLPDLP